MSTFGLIGYPLEHSFSKKYFEEKFRVENIAGCSYNLWPIQSIGDFLPLVRSIKDLKGLNVTIPYKELVIRFLDELDEVANEIKAVNCIKLINGKMKGFNTDVIGLEDSLSKFLSTQVKQAFILGTGGSAKAASYVLKKMGIPFKIVSTKNSGEYIGYTDIEHYMKDSNLFINATPLGMFPEVGATPEIPFEKLTSSDYLFDQIYNPWETVFLKTGKEKGAKAKNGLDMLRVQADKSWEIWNEGETLNSNG